MTEYQFSSSFPAEQKLISFKYLSPFLAGVIYDRIGSPDPYECARIDVKTLHIETLQKIIVDIDNLLAVEPFPWEAVKNIANMFMNNETEVREFLLKLKEIFQHEAANRE